MVIRFVSGCQFNPLRETITGIDLCNFVFSVDYIACRCAHNHVLNASVEEVYTDRTAACADDLMLGAHMAGLALSYARLGVVHGLAHPLGERYQIAHGHICALCLPAALRFNRDAIPDKYATLSEAVGGDILERVETLLENLEVSSPLTGHPPPDDADLIAEVLGSGSTKANPRDVGPDDVKALLAELFQTD